MTSRLPTVFIPHGGGPFPFMEWRPHDMWDGLTAYLKHLPHDIGQAPKALLIVSAHWEEADFTVQTKPAPGLFYDYYGFPENTYQLNWPAPGAPELAARVIELAKAAGITVREDDSRDFDHGVFIPMLLAFPDAGIPTAQLSLKKDLSPADHIALGRALAPLRDEGVLIIGSGMSFHSIPGLMGRVQGVGEAAQAFDAWLQDAVDDGPETLTGWAAAPGARVSHPREEHLIPLMVVAGAADGDSARMTWHQDSLGQTGIALSAFQYG